nr:uncharacterized protein LOC117219890 [Megalopta genalis]
MSETNNNVDDENSDGSSIRFINRKCGSRRRLSFSSDSSDCNSTNFATNTLIGRKRSCNPDKWTRNLQKHNRTKGLAYRNRGGNLIPAKTFVDIKCRCRQKCNQKIFSNERETAMKAFYSLHSQLDQNIFLRGCIKVNEIKRRRPTNETKERRSHSFTYYFRKDTRDIPVCKKYFRDTYQVSDGRIYKCCPKEQVTSLVDLRKGHVASNKIDDTSVIKHIKLFPAYRSHYTRAHNPRRQYLDPDLNIKKMYELYVTECEKENVVPVKEKYYYNVFSTKFNLHFKQPSKDTCQNCDALQIKIQSSDGEAKKMAEIEKETHLEEAERARSQMAADRMATSEKVFLFSFDLEEALAFPKLTTSVAYYKRNLYVYNFGCHEFSKNISHMFVWPETEGSRGSQEISSCLIKYIKTYATNFEKIITYSDSCTGQNRNIKTVLSLLKLVQSMEIRAESIEMKFLVSGHSYLPNDSDFAIIESRAKKNQNIFSPDDWYNIIKTCKKKAPFHLIQMTHQDIFSTKPLEQSIINRKVTVTGFPVNWLKIRWIKLERSKPHLIQFKCDYNEDTEFKAINLRKSVSGRPQSLKNIYQPLLYPKGRTVTREKWRDMMDLLKYIPPVEHDYYKNLTTNRNDESSHPADEEDIIYNISDELITNNII